MYLNIHEFINSIYQPILVYLPGPRVPRLIARVASRQLFCGFATILYQFFRVFLLPIHERMMWTDWCFLVCSVGETTKGLCDLKMTSIFDHGLYIENSCLTQWGGRRSTRPNVMFVAGWCHTVLFVCLHSPAELIRPILHKPTLLCCYHPAHRGI